MKIIIGILLVFFVTFSVGTAFGHGAGIEASPLIFTNDGEVKKILVNDGQPVEFGQNLIILK